MRPRPLLDMLTLIPDSYHSFSIHQYLRRRTIQVNAYER